MAQTIIVDTTPGYRMPTIYYSQGDIGRTFSIDLQSRFGESLPASPTITIQATKPSGLGFSVASTSISGAVVTFTVTETMSNEAGRFPAELKIVKSGTTLFTANFYIECEASAHPEGTTDGDLDSISPKFMSVTTTTLPAGDSATYSYDPETNTATFGIPKGADGSLASQVLAADYSSSKTYAIGDYVYYNGNLYRCTTAITTAEAWTSGHWTQVALGDDVSDLKADLNDTTERVNSSIGAYISKDSGKYIYDNYPTVDSGHFLYADSTMIGQSLNDVIEASQSATYATAVYKRIDVSQCNHIIFPVNKTSQTWGSLIVDDNDIVVQTVLNSTLDSGTLVDISLHPKAKSLIMLFFTGSPNFESNSVFITRYRYEYIGNAEKIKAELKYLLNTDAEVLTRYDFGKMSIYSQGYQFLTTDAIGNSVSSKETVNADYTNYRIDVENCDKVVVPCYISSQNLGYLFADENEIIVGTYTDNGAEHPSRTMIPLEVPDGAKYFYFSVYKGWWSEFDFKVVVAKNEFKGGGSSNIIIHDGSYPSLTDAEKAQIVSLCEDYYLKNNVFRYGGYYRNHYANQSCITSGKFDINCGVFTQFIWMGRSASDFDPSNYSPTITKAFDWGYYFDFAIHKAVYQVAKAQSGTDAQKYYGYQVHTGQEPYAFNAYTQNGAMTWRWFMEAAALAEELYNMGCEVPRRAAEVGDMIFYRGAEYGGMTLESQLNFRNITHVAIITDINYQGSGRMRVAEVTNLSDNGETVNHMSLEETNTYNKVKAGYFESRICMIARHPHAFGVPTNVPSVITAV